MLMCHTCTTACATTDPTTSTAGKELGQKIMSALAQRAFMLAVADTSRALASLADGARTEAVARRPTDPDTQALYRLSYNHDNLGSTTASAIGMYIMTMAQLLCVQLKFTQGEVRSSPPSASTVPAGVLQLVEALVESQLLAAAAAAVVDSPHLSAVWTSTSELASQVFYAKLMRAAHNTTQALALLNQVPGRLAAGGGHEGRRLAVGMLRVARRCSGCR